MKALKFDREAKRLHGIKRKSAQLDGFVDEEGDNISPNVARMLRVAIYKRTASLSVSRQHYIQNRDGTKAAPKFRAATT
jgi:hypothetical protein